MKLARTRVHELVEHCRCTKLKTLLALLHPNVIYLTFDVIIILICSLVIIEDNLVADFW